MIAIVAIRYADAVHLVLLDERSAERHAGRPLTSARPRVLYQGFALWVTRDHYIWYAGRAARLDEVDEIARPVVQDAGEQAEELSHWAFSEWRKLHRGLRVGPDISLLPEVWHDTPFDVALELLARDLPLGVYRVPDTVITPLSTKDRRRMTNDVPRKRRR